MFSLANLSKNKPLINSTQKALNFFRQSNFSSAHGVMEKQVQGRIKVSEKIVWINIVPLDGNPRRCAGYSGESLLDVIQRNNIPGIFADCDGGDNELKPYQIPYDFYSSGVTCAQCQVIIPDPWFDKVNKMINVEQTRLLRVNNPQSSNSRLACCIQVRPEMNEMICVIGNNKNGSGEWFTGSAPDAF